ncbi:MAG TPA: hypothetical protein VMR50_18605 [Myxococcota bacterium]|nr:hypothetical protein [Myxococcota bacterium]
MRLTESLALAALALSLVQPAPARADDADPRDAELRRLYDEMGQLEQRIADLESDHGDHSAVGASGAAAWTERVRLSGSASLAWLDGGHEGIFEHGTVNVYDLRFFVDADLARDFVLGDAKLFRDAGFAFEWNLERVGMLANNLGDVYVDFRGIADQDLLNLQVGRFQLPFGENYLRFGRGYQTDPFIALSAPPPWFWDEGAKLWGKALEGKVSYAFAITDGEGALNSLANGSQMLTLKLAADPFEWLHLSLSGLTTGAVGSDTSPAFASVWLGEMIPRAFGSGTTTPNFDHGVAIPDGPNKLHGVRILGGDAIFKLPDARLWLSYGGAQIDSSGGTTYDRDLIYWLAELMVQMRLISPQLAPAYVAVRASGLGTYSHNEGYLLDFRNYDVGYNMSALQTYALVVGLPLGDYLTLKTQYAWQRIGLVRGVTSQSVKDAAAHPDFFGMEISAHF